ncbi:MAG: DNA replication factor GINS [Haloarculaceae archaeon]|jgi:DNA replication factor GINS
MDLDELQSVRDRERQTDKLQQLRETFYADAGEFIQQLRDQRERAAERADDPFDAPEVSRLSDEIDTAEQTVEAIYEKRVGKIVKAASFAAADLPANSEGMTAEEQDLFETLVENIKANREHVLAVLAGEKPPDGTSPTEPDPTTEASPERDQEAGVNAADVMGEIGSDATDGPTADATEDRDDDAGDQTDGIAQPAPDDSSRREPPSGTDGGTPIPPGASPSDPAKADGTERRDSGSGGESAAGSAGVDRRTVRITDDVGAIFGVDEREYDLSEDDVVALPAANADPLVERDAAEQID